LAKTQFSPRCRRLHTYLGWIKKTLRTRVFPAIRAARKKGGRFEIHPLPPAFHPTPIEINGLSASTAERPEGTSVKLPGGSTLLPAGDNGGSGEYSKFFGEIYKPRNRRCLPIRRRSHHGPMRAGRSRLASSAEGSPITMAFALSRWLTATTRAWRPRTKGDRDLNSCTH